MSRTVSFDIAHFEPGQCKGFSAHGIDGFVVYDGEQFYCYRNQCPHLGTNLEFTPDQFLNIDQSMIQCTLHGALFEIETGKCLFGPCIGQSLIAIPCIKMDQNLIITIKKD